MAYNKVNLGVAAVVFGVVVFVVAAGSLIFQLVGAVLAIIIINHGLQLMGKPPLFTLLQDWFDHI